MKLQLNTPLAPHTTLQVGGSASHFVRATSQTEVSEAIEFAAREGLRLYVLGGGSNLVIADAGVRGLVLQPALGGIDFVAQGADVLATVGAGVAWDEFVVDAVNRNLQGIECLSGIPGLVGATPIQNVGAYGQEVSDVVEHVRVVDRLSGTRSEFGNSACHFKYRDSYFKSEGAERFLVTEVTFRLHPGGPSALRYAELERYFVERGIDDPSLTATRKAVLALRRAKSMLLDNESSSDPNRRSCGSFFVNPVVDKATLVSVEQQWKVPVPRYAQPNETFKLPAAWLIEQSGFSRGYRRGNVGLSSQHCLAIVAHVGATADDVVRFAQAVQDRVHSTFGVKLVPEPNFWGFDHGVDSLLGTERGPVP